MVNDFWFRPDEKANKFLKGMLLSETKQQWDKSYNNALKFIESDPQKRNNLCEIYENPTYYARFYLTSIICNK